MLPVPVGELHHVGVREEARRQQPPQAVDHVDGYRVDGVVDAQLHQQVGAQHVEPAGDEARHDGCVGRHEGASAGDGHQSAEGAVHGHLDDELGLTRHALFPPQLCEERADAAACSAQSRCDGGVGSDLPEVVLIFDEQGRPGVEAEPAEPQDHRPQKLEGDRVARKWARRLQGLTLGVVKTPPPRPQDQRCVQGRQSTVQVDDAAAGKVQDAHIHKGIVVGPAQKAAVAPNRVCNHRVDEARQHYTVGQVGRHLAALRQRPGHNRNAGGTEGVLEEPEGRARPDAHEVFVADEGFAGHRVLVAEIPAEGKGVSDNEKGQGRAAGVEQVLEHGVLDVFQPDRSRAHHGESGLHEEDHAPADHQQKAPEVLVPLLRGLLVGIAHALQQHGGGIQAVGFVRQKPLLCRGTLPKDIPRLRGRHGCCVREETSLQG
mmetsp:Transcript_23431/g.55486  ORF Transcript_23431/g.55486 Transcript_23431/m.55486 type:complete len:432 (-) Transcript_23431:147-1442(-)